MNTDEIVLGVALEQPTSGREVFAQVLVRSASFRAARSRMWVYAVIRLLS